MTTIESAGTPAHEIRARLERRTDEMTHLLGRLVWTESGSDDPAGLNAMSDLLVELFGDLGPIDRHQTGPGGTVISRSPWPGRIPRCRMRRCSATTTRSGRPAHSSGCPCGSRRSVERPGGRLRRAAWSSCTTRSSSFMRPAGGRRPVRFTVGDEEVRSRTSRPLIAELAKGAAVALVLESPLPGGALKTVRKGTGTYRLDIEGRAAHAGIEPSKGASAILELAHQIQVLHGLNDLELGTTVNVGVASGGTRPNVVPARAEAEIDVGHDNRRG